MHLNPRFLFPGQQPDEKIHLVLRQHWMMLATKVFVWLIFVIIYLSFDQILSFLGLGFISPNTQALVGVAKNIYLLYLVLGIFIIWVIYYLNIQIITNERVVDVTQTSLLNHTVSELHLAQLEDVTAEIKGIFPTFFNFGNVYIQTAAEVERFEFNNVPNPAAVTKLILDLYEQLPENKKHRT